jgi:hypothetical protein
MKEYITLISRPYAIGIKYYKNSKLSIQHRKDNKPAELWLFPGKPNIEMFYFKNGSYHREDGPAMLLYDGTMHHFLNGRMILSRNVVNT